MREGMALRLIAERKASNGTFKAAVVNARSLWFKNNVERRCLSDLSPPELPPFDHQPKPLNGPFTDEDFRKRKNHVGVSRFHYNYQKPLNIVEGEMQYFFDENARRYLNAFTGMVTGTCGHNHPVVLNAIVEQNKPPEHAITSRLHPANADFAEALASKVPGNLKVLMQLNKQC